MSLAQSIINIRARTLKVGADNLLFLKSFVLLYVSSAQSMFLIRMLVRTIRRHCSDKSFRFHQTRGCRVAATYYLRIENAEGNVLIAVYLYACVRVCHSHKSKSIKPNRMKFGGMIGYYPGTI